jgi:tRNA dimethylallyltransferase
MAEWMQRETIAADISIDTGRALAPRPSSLSAMLDTRPPAIFLMGATATGKTALACALATRFPFDMISVDSALVYRGLDIGTAKPDAAMLARHPHRLIDIRDPAEPYSAADFRRDARAAMEEITRRGRIPLLVGGTGLYFRALAQGLSDLPEASPAIRARISNDAERSSWAALHARLAELDPAAAARIQPGDQQRIQRALEIIELTGKPVSGQTGGMPERFPWRVLKLALVPKDRADLHAALPALRAVGYRQAWEHLEGQADAPTFRERSIFATRQLAKRQVTWLRGELDALCFDPDAERHEQAVERAVVAFLGPIVGKS